jgi:nucleoside-diphosphate-sugar epimerase
MKNILVIGGSYFAGRVFVEEIQKLPEYRVYVLNRGNLPLKIQNVTEIVCDRHDTEKIVATVPQLEWAAVVDFCAYKPGEIAQTVRSLPGKIKKFIYLSTSTIYKNSLKLPMTEDSETLTGPLPPEMGGDYAYNKLLLEAELKQVCGENNIDFVIVRPSFIYGKYNYAPRESYFFKQISTNEPFILPVAPQALFSMVSVWDVAGIIIACIGNSNVNNKGYIMTSAELVSYDRIIEVLEKITGRKFTVQKQPTKYIDAQRIPIPYPLEEHLIYSGALLRNTLNYQYMSFSTGMTKTYNWFFKNNDEKP